MKKLVNKVELDIQPVDNIGEIMSIIDFIDRVIYQIFIDYDGYVKFIFEEDNTKYEILNISYSISAEEVFDEEDTISCSLIQFCRYMNIKEVIWYNK